jgi:hypothetical protein
MIDADTRCRLSLDVRRLVTGRMTNDAFDDVYYESYEPSGDRAIQEIAAFCSGLYSSDLLWPYHLRGRYAVNADTRSTACRCVLFLRSGLEYQWPSTPDDPVLRTFAGLALFLGIPGGIAILLICVALVISGPDQMTTWLVLLGAVLLVTSTALALGWPRLLANDWAAFRSAGDSDVWPFLRREDFQAACNNSDAPGTGSNRTRPDPV